MGTIAAQNVPSSSASSNRLEALDVARGLMLVVSVAVNAWITAPAWFEHAPWIGVHPIDLVFPVFVTLSGAGLGIAYARRARPAREVRRVVTLALTGVAFTALLAYIATGAVEAATFDHTGVLQLYAAIVAGMVLLRMACRQWWHWLLAGLLLAAAHTLLLGTWADGCPQGVLTLECNPSRVIDVAVFGAPHVYVEGTRGHDPEWSRGARRRVGVGGLWRRGGAGHARSRPGWVGAAVSRGGSDRGRGGSAREPCCRVVRPRVQAPLECPFRAGRGGCSRGGAVDTSRGARRSPRSSRERVVRYPPVSLGRNSLLVYFGSHAVTSVLLRTSPTGQIPTKGENLAHLWQRDLAGWVDVEGAAWPLCVVAVLAWTLLAMLLHSRRIYVKA